VPQVGIPGVGRVDLLIGDRLVLEVDGRAFHSSTPDFARDRERDLTLAGLGFRVLRLSYGQVVADWPASEAAIRAVVDAGEHLAQRRNSG
jgi:very-short-patch-repair endonuclease